MKPIAKCDRFRKLEIPIWDFKFTRRTAQIALRRHRKRRDHGGQCPQQSRSRADERVCGARVCADARPARQHEGTGEATGRAGKEIDRAARRA